MLNFEVRLLVFYTPLKYYNDCYNPDIFILRFSQSYVEELINA